MIDEPKPADKWRPVPEHLRVRRPSTEELRYPVWKLVTEDVTTGWQTHQLPFRGHWLVRDQNIKTGQSTTFVVYMPGIKLEKYE